MASPLRYLHGAEVNVTKTGPVFFQTPNPSVIGLVGTAPIHLLGLPSQKVNQLELVYSDQRAGRLFGQHRPGFTLPSALKAIYGKTGAQVLAINVFDPARHRTAVTATPMSFAQGRLQLPEEDILEVTVTDTAANTTYAEGTDYILSKSTGLITRTADGSISDGESVKVAYAYADLSKVTSADVIGTVDAHGKRSGIQLWQEGLITYGRKPKLLGAPGFATSVPVRDALAGAAEKFRGHCFVDAPASLAAAAAITARGPNGTAEVFFTSGARTILCYPMVKEYDPLTDTNVLAPYSQHLIGLTSAVQNREGIQFSPSNHEIRGITGTELPLSSDYTNPDAEVNLLNEVGVTSIYRGFGTGNRAWGNRTAAWPTATHVSTFMSVQAVSDLIADTLEINSLQFIDKPLNIGAIDSIVKSTQAFLDRMINLGVLLGGQVWFEADDNDQTQLSAGWLRFRLDQQGPPPTERLTYEQEYNIGYLAELAAEAAAAYGRAA